MLKRLDSRARCANYYKRRTEQNVASSKKCHISNSYWQLPHHDRTESSKVFLSITGSIKKYYRLALTKQQQFGLIREQQLEGCNCSLTASRQENCAPLPIDIT
ncbi:hypothetical protein ANTPLA_LOCUS3277 [Anthophora plagiata]